MRETLSETCRSSHRKLFCFAQNSDTVGGENQSSPPREWERRNENRERLWLLWWTLVSTVNATSYVLAVYQITRICITFPFSGRKMRSLLSLWHFDEYIYVLLKKREEEKKLEFLWKNNIAAVWDRQPLFTEAADNRTHMTMALYITALHTFISTSSIITRLSSHSPSLDTDWLQCHSWISSSSRHH